MSPRWKIEVMNGLSTSQLREKDKKKMATRYRGDTRTRSQRPKISPNGTVKEREDEKRRREEGRKGTEATRMPDKEEGRSSLDLDEDGPRREDQATQETGFGQTRLLFNRERDRGRRRETPRPFRKGRRRTKTKKVRGANAPMARNSVRG